MRTGTAIKSAIETTLRKTWSAANNGTNLDGLIVRFAGTGASMSEHATTQGLRVVISLPDFKDAHAYTDAHADRILAYALHEIGHAFFTDSHAWDAAIRAVMQVDMDLLHRCINAFDDVQQEAALIRSGYAVGAKRLLTGLLEHITRDCDAKSFSNLSNIPFAVCVDGRDYGISVAHLVPQQHAALVTEAVAKAKALTCTADAIEAGHWLWQKLKQAQQDQANDNSKPSDEQSDGESDGESDGSKPSNQQKDGKNKTAKSTSAPAKELSIEPTLDDLPLEDTA